MELKNLTDEELLQLYEKTKEDIEYKESMSQSFKILLNSQYGAGALAQNPYSNGKLTNSSVTITGRMLTQLMGIHLSNIIKEDLGEPISDNISEIVQSDTDSVYLGLGRLVSKIHPDSSEEEILKWVMNYYETKLKPGVDYILNKVCDTFNMRVTDVLKMDMETVSTSFCSIASKRYFCRVKINDGNVLATPKEKVTGVSLVSKSTPKKVKSLLKPILKYILDFDEKGMQNYIKEQYEGFGNFKPADLSKSSSVSEVNGWNFVSKGNNIINWFEAVKVNKWNGGKFQTAPLNSYGSCVHNTLIKELKIDNKYEPIVNSDKVFILYLNTPNPITGNNKVISFKDPEIFNDTGLYKYVDFQLTWEKEVLNKIKILTNTIGWKTEAVASLDDW